MNYVKLSVSEMSSFYRTVWPVNLTKFENLNMCRAEECVDVPRNA